MTKEEIEQYRRRMAALGECEKRWPSPLRDPAAVLADLSFLLSFVAPAELLRDPDPEKLGIQKMRAGLALIGRRA